jgi:hypothetical protein
MGRTERQVLVAGSIAFLLALTALAAGAAPAAAGAVQAPSAVLPASPSASAEPTTAAQLADRGHGMRPAIELIVLALTCSIVVAFFSATAGERGGTRVPARVRRR